MLPTKLNKHTPSDNIIVRGLVAGLTETLRLVGIGYAGGCFGTQKVNTLAQAGGI